MVEWPAHGGLNRLQRIDQAMVEQARPGVFKRTSSRLVFKKEALPNTFKMDGAIRVFSWLLIKLLRQRQVLASDLKEELDLTSEVLGSKTSQRKHSHSSRNVSLASAFTFS